MTKSTSPLLLAALFAVAGCSDDAEPAKPSVDGGVDTGADAGSDAPIDPKGGVKLTVSGEKLAAGGFTFPASTADDPVFVDGWEVKFEKALVTVGEITLSEDPDKDPKDGAKTGAAVARLDGTFAVDLHKSGGIDGKGGSDERAFPIGTLANQNLKGGAAFDETKRYAFGFKMLPATAAATKVNFDATDADYAEMVTKGWTVLYVGTATFKGTDCKTKPGTTYDFTKIPKTVKFRFGFKSPVSNLNCQNPDNDPAKPFDGEEHQRGIQIKANTTTIAQATIHLDHPFWDALAHDAPLHFDHIAARVAGMPDGSTVTLADLEAADPTDVKDKNGVALPWRWCVADYTPPAAATMSLDLDGVPFDPKGTPDKALRHLADYMTYLQSTQGHLNADGLCAVQRSYPSP